MTGTKVIPPKELLEATIGGLSVLVVTGGADGDVLTKQSDGTYVPVTPSAASGDVVGPASATDNAIARFDATTGKLVQNSVVIVTDAGSVLASVGTVAAPAYGFVGNTNTGIYNRAAYRTSIAAGGTVGIEFDNGGAYIAAGSGITFLTGAVGTGSDLGLIRSAAGVLKVHDGSTGFGNVSCDKVLVKPYTVGTLPSAATWDGYTARVTDSNVAASGNYGATVAGGGANKVRVFSDGTNWVIA